MNLLLRASRALFLPLLLLSPVPAAAQVAAPVPATAAIPAPRYAHPEDPWIYRGTDIPPDKQWLFGELPNGLRYAVRRNGVPPGQVSIRVRIDAGSLHERQPEQGFAHLIEHLTFRESKSFKPGEAIPHFQRLGAALGTDTNALTTPTQTVYKLDLPNATRASVEETVRLLAGMIREPVFNKANLAAEVPIVLAERRDGDGVDRRAADATREVFFAGQKLASRSPIGTVASLQGAAPQAVQAFHRRWYRPQNATVVLVGDADPALLAGLVEKYFTDWQVAGQPEQAPDFGKPVAPAGSDPSNPVGEVRVLVEPGQPRSLSYAVVRPWQGVIDNMEYNRGLMIDAVAEAIVNRRLEEAARAGGSYLAASVERQKTSRSNDATFVSVTPLTGDWKTALSSVRAVIADALATPPSTDEIDRVLSDLDVAFVNQVEQDRNLAGAQLADNLVEAVDIGEAIGTAELSMELLRSVRDRLTPALILEHTRSLFTGTVIRALYLTPERGEADAASLRAALLAPADASAPVRPSESAITFADLPPVGTAAAPTVREPLGLFVTNDVEKVTFANGVRALLWRTEHEPGRTTVRVRFGSGLSGIAPEEAVYAQLAPAALVASGVGPLGINELDRITTGRKLGFDLRMGEGAFVFDAMTRSDDVADQLYLFAAKLAMPRWDAAPFERAKAAALLSYESFSGNPQGVIQRELGSLLHGGDPRFGQATPQALQGATAEGFAKVWSRLLSQGPVEVLVFGDFDRESAVEALSRTFGALPPRDAIAAPVTGWTPFPQGNAQPIVLNHQGEADQAAAVIAWPTGGGSQGIRQSRKLEVLADVFSNRLMDALREKAGASYTPFVRSEWPLDASTGGNILALAQLPPAQVPAFFSAADQIAADLAATGPTADELDRVTEPMKQLLDRVQTSHSFWVNQIEGAAFDTNRLASLPSIMDDYAKATPQEMQALAARYLAPGRALRASVLPQRAASTRAR